MSRDPKQNKPKPAPKPARVRQTVTEDEATTRAPPPGASDLETTVEHDAEEFRALRQAATPPGPAPTIEISSRFNLADIDSLDDADEEDSKAQWVDLIGELTDDRRAAKNKPASKTASRSTTKPAVMPAHKVASDSEATAFARAGRRSSRRASSEFGDPITDAEAMARLEEELGTSLPAFMRGPTNPDVELTQKMQDRFLSELRSELDADGPGPGGEPDPHNVWEQYPPNSEVSTNPEQNGATAETTMVTLVSTPSSDDTLAHLDQHRSLTTRPETAPGAAAVEAAAEATDIEHEPLPAPTIEAAKPPQDGVPFGHYWLRRRLKVGGMGEVYLANAADATGISREVAIKRILLPLAQSGDFVKMFIDEAKITVQLQHASIVQVYELGQVNDQYFIAMEYVNGRDLDTIMQAAHERGDPFPISIALYIMQHVLDGLDYAHRKLDHVGKSLGIVHRDVSPPNILCSFEGQVKITDFGIAKAASKVSRTAPRLLLGKICYMSPEQIRALAVDRRSDIFATAVILYEMLSGVRLFLGKSDVETIRNVALGSIPPIQSQRPDVPDDLAELLHKALKRNPIMRPQWASEMSEALQQIMLSHGYRSPQRELVDFLDGLFGGEPPGEPIFTSARG